MQEEKLRLEDLLESSDSANDDDRINHPYFQMKIL